MKGRQWIGQNTRGESVEHFNRVQRLWSIWGATVVFAGSLLYVLAFALSMSSGQG